MFDFLLIGHGLAGSVLSLTLKKLGKSVLVIDKAELSSCSRVAAGIINPLAIRRFSMSWRADELIPFLEKFYPEAETLLGTRFYHPCRMLKPYGSATDKVQWLLKKSDPALAGFLAKDDVFCDAPVINPFGCLEILRTGWLDTMTFLEANRKFLADNYREENFDHTALEFEKDFVRYKDIEAGRLIFCEGFRAMENNHWFKEIPFALTKGQVLDVEIENWKNDDIINRGAFILPKADGTYRLGATYSWKDYSETVSEAASTELISKAGNYLNAPIRILEAKAGIRPTIKDRRPVLGIHPEYPQMAIFNGLGSKAVMFAPLLADQLTGHLLEGHDLFPEIKLSRFSF